MAKTAQDVAADMQALMKKHQWPSEGIAALVLLVAAQAKVVAEQAERIDKMERTILGMNRFT